MYYNTAITNSGDILYKFDFLELTQEFHFFIEFVS